MPMPENVDPHRDRATERDKSCCQDCHSTSEVFIQTSCHIVPPIVQFHGDMIWICHALRLDRPAAQKGRLHCVVSLSGIGCGCILNGDSCVVRSDKSV